MCICSICSEEYLNCFMQEAFKLLGKFTLLLDSFILDFFVENHWKILPQTWQDTLLNIKPEDLGHWINNEEEFDRYNNVWPLSLLAFKSSVSNLAIPRQAEHCGDSSTHHCIHCQFIDLRIGQDDNKLFSKYTKPKKFHEINKMAKVTSSCAEKQNCKFIVDVGSGLGHLGRLLALKYGLRICCLEEQTSLYNKARRLDEKILKVLNKETNGYLVPPVHINISLETAIKSLDFSNLVREAFGLSPDSIFRFGIVGLHPCGDLGPTLLRLLVDCPEACFINLVGCCYMKLSDDSSDTALKGYPLSSRAKLLDHRLSYEAREVACHAIENYCQRLKNGYASELKVHCYRAVLENIIVKLWPELKHSGLRSIKNVKDMDFVRYTELAVDRLGLKLPGAMLDTEETRSQLEQWNQVVTFYSLRIMLAQSVESVLLIDRMLFLHETGIFNLLLPGFDPEISPRNHILIAMKNLN